MGSIPFHNGRPDHRRMSFPAKQAPEGLKGDGVMIGKLFGKHASIAAMVAIFVVGGLTAIKVIDLGTGAMILGLLGVQGAASDSAVKPAK